MAENKDVETFAFQAEVRPAALLALLLGLCGTQVEADISCKPKVLSSRACAAQINQLLSLIINTVRCLTGRYLHPKATTFSASLTAGK